MTIEVCTAAYARSHQRQPRGQGYWAFRHGKTRATLGEFRFYNGTYAEAKRAAVEAARQDGARLVEVGP